MGIFEPFGGACVGSWEEYLDHSCTEQKNGVSPGKNSFASARLATFFHSVLADVLKQVLVRKRVFARTHRKL